MIKVVIVDDEMLVRIGMKSVIPWAEYGFDIVGEASDGREALALCEKEAPDLLLVDIVMPNMDGMELIRSVKERYPGIACVILTCLDEMHYVKEAMALGAAGYFTKISIDQTQMLELLLQLKRTIESRKRKDSEIVTLRKYIEQHKWLLNERLFQDILDAQSREGGAWRMLLPEEMRAVLDADTLIVVRMAKQVKDAGSERVLKESLFNVLDAIVGRHLQHGGVFPVRDFEYVIVGRALNAGPADGGEWQAFVQEVKESLRIYFNIAQTDILQTPMPSFGDLRDCYREIKRQFQSRIVGSDDRGAEGDDFEAVYDRIESLLLSAVAEGSRELAFQALQRLFDAAADCRLELERMRKYALQVLFVFEKEIRRHGESIDHWFMEDVVGRMIHSASFESLKADMLEVVPEIVDRLLDMLESSLRIEIVKVTDFIHRHYNEKLTLDYAASIVSMNSAYFSRLFKKEVGMGFVEYLTSYRIGKAKELLRHRSLRIAEVAAQIGYEDENYFSKVFKRYVGVSPSQYRAENG